MTKRTTGFMFWIYMAISGGAFCYGFQLQSDFQDSLVNGIVYGFIAGSLWLGLFSLIYIFANGKDSEESDTYEDLML